MNDGTSEWKQKVDEKVLEDDCEDGVEDVQDEGGGQTERVFKKNTGDEARTNEEEETRRDYDAFTTRQTRRVRVLSAI
jgi:hypothetical protein